MKKQKSKKHSSWQPVHKWYNKIVGKKGHYYHREVIFPKLLPYLNLEHTDSPAVLDLACGNGILLQQLPPNLDYCGIDIAAGLVDEAKKSSSHKRAQFYVGDIEKKLPCKSKTFSHVVINLAIQNLQHPDRAIANAAAHLRSGGELFIILNHPSYRIPRQTSWEVDKENKIQYRRVNGYMQPKKIPIQMHPSKGKQSATTWSFHFPLSAYSRWLKESGFLIETIDEWCSNKQSEGGAAKMENLARDEIPLFMMIAAVKKI